MYPPTPQCSVISLNYHRVFKPPSWNNQEAIPFYFWSACSYFSEVNFFLFTVSVIFRTFDHQDKLQSDSSSGAPVLTVHVRRKLLYRSHLGPFYCWMRLTEEQRWSWYSITSPTADTNTRGFSSIWLKVVNRRNESQKQICTQLNLQCNTICCSAIIPPVLYPHVGHVSKCSRFCKILWICWRAA